MSFLEVNITPLASNDHCLSVLLILPEEALPDLKPFIESHHVFHFKILHYLIVKGNARLFEFTQSLNLNKFNFVLIFMYPFFSRTEFFQSFENASNSFTLTDSDFENVLKQFTADVPVSCFADMAHSVPVYLVEFFKRYNNHLNSFVDSINNCLAQQCTSDVPVNLIRFSDDNSSLQPNSDKKLPKSIFRAIFADALKKATLPKYTVCTVKQNPEHFLLREKSTETRNIRQKSPYLLARIQNYPVEILVDTGSEITLCNQLFYENLKNVTSFDFPTLPVVGLTISGVTGVKSRNVKFQIFVELEINAKIFQTTVLIVPGIQVDFILGMDFLAEYKVVIDCEKRSINFKDHGMEIPWLYNSSLEVNRVVVSNVSSPGTVIILADSHGHRLKQFLRPKLKNWNLRVTVKPGKVFNEVIHDLSLDPSKFSERDVIVVIAGTNNLKSSQTKNVITSGFNFDPLKSVAARKVIFEIFQRFDEPNLNDLIHDVNLFIRKSLTDQNCSIVETREILKPPDDFTRHGLHLSLTGKKKLSDIIVERVNELNSAYKLPQLSSNENKMTLNNHRLLRANINTISFNLGSITEQDVLDKLSGVNLPPEYKARLMELILRFREVFSDLPGKIKGFKATLRISDFVTFMKRSYPVPFSKKESVRREILRMLELDIIEISYSPYSSPIVPVIKANGDVRLCLDARAINTKLISDAEAPEHIDTLLASCPNPNCISTFDCTASFWQVELDEESRDLCSFIFEGKNYRFKRLPFGTKVSGQFFNKAGTYVFGPEFDHFLKRFFDDFRITSKNFEEHLHHLTLFFMRALIMGMTFKFSKCKFLEPSMDWLGYVLSGQGIQMCPDKLRAIKEFPVPSCLKDLQAFCGLVNFYKRFFLRHAHLLAPLLSLFKKGVTWKWSENEQLAFDEAKETFCTDVMLAYPCFTKKFYLGTDASVNAIAAELFQYDEEENRRPVAFHSRILTSAEKSYTSTEIELLSIVSACQKFRQYILGFPVIVETDHNALVFLNRCALSSGRLTRWVLFLQEYDLSVGHIKGSENVAMDILSRYPPELPSLPPNNTVISVNFSEAYLPKTFNNVIKNLSEKQLADDHLGKIYKNVKNSVDFVGKELYLINETHLFSCACKDGLYRLCIPAVIENEVIQAAHEGLAHLGTNKTYNYLKNFVVFPRMEVKVRNFVRACVSCQKNKVPNKVYHAPLVSVEAHEPLELVSADLFGPLPTSKGNFSFVLVCLDVFSKFVKLYPVRRATGVQVTRKVIDKYITEVGKPKKIVADRGPCFYSKYWDSQLKLQGIQPTHSSVYHPASNPVERYMRTLGEMCRAYCNEKHTTWATHLPFFENCFNNAIHETTGVTPLEILKKESPHNFLAHLVDFPKQDSRPNLQLKLAILEKNSRKKLKKRKVDHDKNLSFHKFNAGDKVLVKTHHLSNALNAQIKKFFCLFEGPYEIVHEVGKNAFKLKDRDTHTVIGVYNAVYLKPFIVLKDSDAK